MGFLRRGPFGLIQTYDFDGVATERTIIVPPHYRHLMLVASLRSTHTANPSGARIRCGTGGVIDTGANYGYMRLGTDNSTPADGPAFLGTDRVDMDVPALGGTPAPDGVFASVQVMIYDYRGTKRKGIVGTYGMNWLDAAANWRYRNFLAHWTNTAVLDRLQVYEANAAAFTAGSTLSLYGLA